MINPSKTQVQKVIEAIFAPAHANAFEALLDEPLASAFNKTTADRATRLLEGIIINVSEMFMKIIVELGQGSMSSGGKVM